MWSYFVGWSLRKFWMPYSALPLNHVHVHYMRRFYPTHTTTMHIKYKIMWNQLHASRLTRSPFSVSWVVFSPRTQHQHQQRVFPRIQHQHQHKAKNNEIPTSARRNTIEEISAIRRPLLLFRRQLVVRLLLTGFAVGRLRSARVVVWRRKGYNWNVWKKYI